MASLIRRRGYVSLRGNNLLLTPTYDYIHDCNQEWHTGLDPEVGSSLEYKYSVTRGAANAPWYSPCVRRSLGWVSARSLGKKVRWVVGWLCGRMFYWCEMVKRGATGA